MENPRPEKVAIVQELKARLTQTQAVLVSEYRGLKVSELEQLRRELKAKGGEFKIYKNTLVRLAAKETGNDGLEAICEGPTALTFVSDDAAAIAKSLRDFSRNMPALVLKGGLLGGKVLSPSQTAALAELPSKEQLLAQFAGALSSPMVNFAGLLKAVPQNFAYAISGLIGKRQEEASDA